jgi:hypothetical protein
MRPTGRWCPAGAHSASGGDAAGRDMRRLPLVVRTSNTPGWCEESDPAATRLDGVLIVRQPILERIRPSMDPMRPTSKPAVSRRRMAARAVCGPCRPLRRIAGGRWPPVRLAHHRSPLRSGFHVARWRKAVGHPAKAPSGDCQCIRHPRDICRQAHADALRDTRGRSRDRFCGKHPQDRRGQRPGTLTVSPVLLPQAIPRDRPRRASASRWPAADIAGLDRSLTVFHWALRGGSTAVPREATWKRPWRRRAVRRQRTQTNRDSARRLAKALRHRTAARCMRGTGFDAGRLDRKRLSAPRAAGDDHEQAVANAAAHAFAPARLNASARNGGHVAPRRRVATQPEAARAGRRYNGASASRLASASRGTHS